MNSDKHLGDQERQAAVIAFPPKPNGAGHGRKPGRQRVKDGDAAEVTAREHAADWPALHPLYNVDKIARSPEAGIVVCASEKAADAAALLFPKRIATASPSGDGSRPAPTDWKPLAGRRVLLGPANDSSARKRALERAADLVELDCEVSIVDAAALAVLEPAGGVREPRSGYDAAAALADWAAHTDWKELRKKVEDLAERFVPRPDYVSHWPFTMDANGLTKEVEHREGDSKRTEMLKISAPFEVLGIIRDAHGAGWGKALRWLDRDCVEHTRIVAEADLHGDPAVLCGSLAGDGLWIVPKRRREFVDYLSQARVERRLRSAERTGWCAFGGRSYFVLPTQAIGPRGGERIILERAAHGPYAARGTLEEWRAGVARLAAGHVMPVLAISAALAGPLLRLANLDGGALHFFGESSKGKTTLLQMAASVWGRGGTPGYVRAWHATANGLEGAAASATDTLLVLDELGQTDPRDVAGMLYSLANGAGKARAMRDGGLREPRTWRVLTMSSGELSIETKLAEDRGRKSRAGQLVRMLGIKANRSFGVFDHSGPNGDAAAYAGTCKRAAVSAYGTAGPKFVEQLIAKGIKEDDVSSMIAEFAAAQTSPDADGQVKRAAQRLGLIAAAGELAIEFGLTGWRRGEAHEAAAWGLEQWIEERGGVEPAEVRQAISQIRHMIEAHGDSRFEWLNDAGRADVDAKPVNNRLGWRKGTDDEVEWWVPPEIWKAEACNGLDPRRVAQVLAERGMLRRQEGRHLQCKVRIRSTLRRVYVITSAILAGGDDDEC